MDELFAGVIRKLLQQNFLTFEYIQYCLEFSVLYNFDRHFSTWNDEPSLSLLIHRFICSKQWYLDMGVICLFDSMEDNCLDLHNFIILHVKTRLDQLIFNTVDVLNAFFPLTNLTCMYCIFELEWFFNS